MNFSIKDAASILGITPQAVYVAITSGYLNADKIEGKWSTSLPHIDEYRKNRYSRLKSKDSRGRFIYSEREGRLSPRMVAKQFNVPYHRVYYFIYKKILPYTKVKSYYVIQKEDVERIGFD